MTLLHQAAQKAVEAALRRAFHLGQIYWQQADSESRAQNRQAEATQLKFDTLIAETVSALQQQEVPREPPESELVCYEAYAALGMFLMELAEGGHPQAEKLLDNLSQARLVHKDLLPFSPSTTQQQEAGNGWRSIESAPKDGTEILVWRDDAGAFMAMWTCVNDLRTTSDKDRDELDEDTLFSYDWFGGDAEGNFRCDGSEAPTHWQPMPAAHSTPESAEKDDAGGGKEADRG